MDGHMDTPRKFGWRPDVPDRRDFKYKITRPIPLPDHIDLRRQLPPIWDQGQLGSCTGHAIGAAFAYNLRKQKAKEFEPSRLFIYYNERSLEGTVPYDAGAQIRNGIKAIAKFGVTSEVLWPYSDQDPGPYQTKPPKAAFVDGLDHQALLYFRVPQTLRTIQQCLAEGWPVIFGFTVYESFMSEAVAKTGIMSMPGRKEGVIGGHAVLAVGYNNATKCFLVRNSWSAGWGLRGYFWMPYAVLTNSNLSDDLWTLRLVEQG